MQPKPPRKFIMEVYEGEELIGGWVTQHISGMGVFKLLVKKRKDGMIEWAHFLQGEDGTKGRILRGEVNSQEQLDEVIGDMNRNLKQILGVTLQAGDYDVRAANGKRPPDNVQ